MNAVIVLNASFEPLGVVPLRRAVVHLLRERATVVEAVPGAVYRSATAEFPVPRVVQFRTMIRAPHRYEVQAWTRHGVISRDAHTCAYCGSRSARTVDHVMPRSRGGKDEWMNTVAACLRCNGAKADRTPDEAGMALLFQPRNVNTRDTLIAAMAGTGADLVSLGFA